MSMYVLAHLKLAEDRKRKRFLHLIMTAAVSVFMLYHFLRILS